jgi:hypothetical protein
MRPTWFDYAIDYGMLVIGAMVIGIVVGVYT